MVQTPFLSPTIITSQHQKQNLDHSLQIGVSKPIKEMVLFPTTISSVDTNKTQEDASNTTCEFDQIVKSLSVVNKPQLVV